MTDRRIVNEKLRRDIKQWRSDHFNVNWTEIAKHSGIAVHYLLDFKDGRREFGDVVGKRLQDFIDENSN